jgi:N-dimethylarginine dimethylaminohydrolase
MAGYFLDSEYRPLKAVLLCKPSSRIGNVIDPGKVLHLKKIDPAVMEKEFQGIVMLYKKLRVKFYLINTGKASNADNRYLFNMMFTRDVFFMTGRGAVLSRMASVVRRQEPVYAGRALEKIGVPIRKVIHGSATFEAADALWVTSGLVAIGVGNRTNNDGFMQIKEELKSDGIRCVRLPAPRGALHLLGALQLIDKDLVLVRVDLVKQDVASFLKENKIRIIEIPENDEVKNKQAFNFVTLAPRKIIMPAFCPRTKAIFTKQGIEVVAEIPVTQLINAGGGLACATGILARQRH